MAEKELSINNAQRHICYLSEEDAKEEASLKSQAAGIVSYLASPLDRLNLRKEYEKESGELSGIKDVFFIGYGRWLEDYVVKLRAAR